MGSSGESGNNGIDGTVGTLVWVRRRNGSWWPGRIVGLDELTEEFVVSPRSGTPVKLLGRDDASVDWYNLEKSKRVKAFRCGEYEECIKKAKAAAANPNKKAVKYARREDAIIHALEIENERLGKDNVNISSQMSNSGGDHDCSATSHSGEENGDMSYDGRRRRTPNDSEDDGTEGVKRMRGLQDLGMGVVSKRSVQTEGRHENASILDINTESGMPNGSLSNGSKSPSSLRRKRSVVATANELLRRKSRSKPLTKVLESTEMVCIPVAGDLLPKSSASSLQLSDGKVPEIEQNESKRGLSTDHTRVSCEIDAYTDAPEQATVSSSINRMKENEIPSKSELLENGSSKKIYDVRPAGEEKRSLGKSAVLAPCSSGRPEIGAVGRQSTRTSQAEAVSLRNEKLNDTAPTSSAVVHDIGQSIEKGIRRSDVLCHVSDLKRNCNGINGSATFNHTLQGRSKQVAELSAGPPQRSLPYRQSRSLVPARYQTSDSISHSTCSDAALYDVKLEVKTKYRTQHVPLVSLTSKLNGGEAAERNVEIRKIPTKHLGSPKSSPKSKKSGLLQKKTRKLSSLTGHRHSGERNLPINKSSGTVIACIPLKVVFSRINEAVSGLARPTHHVLKTK